MHSLSKKECEQRSKELAQRLQEKIGGVWKSEVWYNLGWYYKVGLGSIGVYADHYSDEIVYSVMIGDKIGETTAGDIELHNFAEEKTRSSNKPEIVVKAALYALRKSAKKADMLYKAHKQLINQTK